MNLVLNACDAIEKAGTVSVSLSYVGIDADDSWRPDHLKPGSYARLEVQDTGCGMDAETLSRVFEPFFTTKEIGKGTGLGLATVYGIVRQFGGHIDIDSSPGNGARVLVYFPRTEGDERRSVLMDPDAVAGGNATVLLVDDESGIRKIMATQLRKQGYEVIEAADGEEALTAGTAEGVRVDLLITDIVMPRLGGPAVATALIKVFPEMKIVLMSGYSESMNTELDHLLPDAEFLEKPLRMSELAETAERLLASASNSS
jgi:CheY-like chemotaxis protein